MVTNTRRGAILATVLLLALWAAPAGAALDLLGTRGIAMGGALRASPSGESAVLLNPAGMTLTRSYVINALYEFRVSDSASLLNASVVDSLTSRVAAGLYYSFSHATPSRVLSLGGGKVFELEETRMTHEAGLAMSYPVGTYLHLGVSTRYVNISVEQPDNTPKEAVVEDDINSVTGDIGGIITPLEGLRIAVVGYNLIPVEGTEFLTLLGLGISYTFGSRFLAEFDTVLDFTREETAAASYHGGLELFLGQNVALRGGFMHDTVREASYASGGLGFISRKMGVDFGLRQMVDGGAETLLAFSIRLFMMQ